VPLAARRRSQRTLEALDVVLLTEQLQYDVVRLAQAAGWHFWDVTRGDKRASTARPDAAAAAVRALPPADAALLAARVAHDAALYARAAQLADEAATRRGRQPPLRAASQRCEQLENGVLGPGAQPGFDDAARWGLGWAPLRADGGGDGDAVEAQRRLAYY
jgi:hypothetical protein